MLVERSWTERTKEKLKMITISLPFFIGSAYLVLLVPNGIIAGMTLLIGSIFIVIPLSLMFGIDFDHYKVVEENI